MNLFKGKVVYVVIMSVLLVGGAAFYFKSKKQEAAVIKKPSIEEVKSKDENNPSDVVNNQAENSNIPTSDSVSDSTENSSQDSGNKTAVDSKGVDNTEPSKDTSSGFKIINNLVSFGFQKSSGRSIDTLIVHSSYDAIGNDPYSVSGIIAEYKGYGVSPHYLIDRKGNVYRLVEDQNIAYHAGDSKMPDGRTGVNNFSIGVEIMTSKTDKPTQDQYAALNGLINYLKGKYKIKNILGHSQIAPGRKDDPWNFDWGKVNK